MARVGEEFPLECPNCGGDIRLIALHQSQGRSGRSSRILANRLSNQPSRRPGARRPTAASSCRPMTTATSCKRHPTNCPQSISTASERYRPQAVEAPGTANWDAVCADARKPPPQGARGVVANRRRTADTPNLAAQGQSVSRKTAAEVPLTGLSFRSGCGAFRETRSRRPGRSSRGSRVAHQPDDR